MIKSFKDRDAERLFQRQPVCEQVLDRDGRVVGTSRSSTRVGWPPRRGSPQLLGRATALRALSAQYEQAQQQHAVQVETLQQQVEALEQQVAQLSGRVTPLAQNYRTLAETLRGRWS